MLARGITIALVLAGCAGAPPGPGASEPDQAHLSVGALSELPGGWTVEEIEIRIDGTRAGVARAVGSGEEREPALVNGATRIVAEAGVAPGPLVIEAAGRILDADGEEHTPSARTEITMPPRPVAVLVRIDLEADRPAMTVGRVPLETLQGPEMCIETQPAQEADC
jgi:hypothetical protein